MIGSSFVGLEVLTSLNLNNNKLTGEIPDYFLSENSEILCLVLHGNKLTGNIPPISSKIDLLDLSYNMLTSVPVFTFPQDSAIDIMFINDNPELSGTIPAYYTDLPKLRMLWIGGTKIHGEISYEFSQKLTWDYTKNLITIQSENLGSCAICQNDMDFTMDPRGLEYCGLSIETTVCDHTMHRDCLSKWRSMCKEKRVVSTCPMCRQVIT